MNNIKIYSLSQHGGAPKKTSKKLKSPKQIKSGSKVKGLTAVNPLVKITEEQTVKIDNLTENISKVKELYSECIKKSEDIIKNNNTVLSNIQKDIEEKQRTQEQTLKNEFEAKQQEIKLEEQKLYDSNLSKINTDYDDKLKLIPKTYETTLQEKKQQQLQEINNDKSTQLTDIITQLETEYNNNVSAIKVEPSESLIKSLADNYNINNNSMLRKHLVKLCPIDSTNKVCDIVKKIPNIYKTIETVGCLANDYVPNFLKSYASPGDKDQCARACIAENPSYIYSGYFSLARGEGCLCGTQTEMNQRTYWGRMKFDMDKCNLPCKNNPSEKCNGDYTPYGIPVMVNKLV